MANFKEVDPRQNFPELEREILNFWNKNDIFKKSVEQNKDKEKFIFYEGPPTANGKPGIHHMLSRSFKDIVLRYKTMKGFYVKRRAGWDTHGLPVEIQVEKELGISGKQDIEKYGIAKFNEKCKESVWKFKEDWEKMTERMGYWLDMENAYITYKNEYIEKVWGILKQIWDKDLIYKGYKSVPWCPRCGTVLSSHEVAQGYKNIEDESIFIKFELIDQKNVYLLAWTTTPWTLPGNIALAVGKNITYVKVKQDDDFLILAKDLVSKVLGKDVEVVEELTGKDLVGLKYQPLFDNSKFIKTLGKNDFQVWAADFVATDEGTGVVHIAPAFGEDDLNLHKSHGFSIPVTMDPAGKMLFEIGEGKFVKDADEDIKKDLISRNILFKEQRIKHEYPFCWRCDTPLIYYARHSWFIAMSKLREELEANNQKINWHPEYIKFGRFGGWLSEVKDWALSRERYWGTPLPIWECKCGEKQMIGSVEELMGKSDQKTTKIVIARHGESEKNVAGINSHTLDKFPLTEKGVREVQKLRDSLDNNFDLIISSPLLRTKQTAEIFNEKLKIEIIYDERINEINFGKWNDRPKDELLKNDDSYIAYKKINNLEDKFHYSLGEIGESRNDLLERTKSFLNDIAKKYAGKNILIVGHGGTNAAINKILKDISLEEYWEREDINHNHLDTFFLNENGKLFDLHKPFIDEIKIKCPKCGGEATRVKEVIDVWFDAGSMPFATDEYPENYPADYIAEAIDQTRGWFYTMLAISTLLEKGTSYKNVICLGHILDERGIKMSKSKGNIIDPMLIMDKFGADAVRWLLYTINGPGDSKRIGEKNVQEALRKFVLLLWNVYSFFVTYANIDGWKFEGKHWEPKQVLDRWVVSSFYKLVQEMEEKLDNFDIVGAARSIEQFNNDLSTWYLRRSRKRRDSDFYATMFKVLVHFSKVIAPFVPFVAEKIYQGLYSKGSNYPESVHLCSWPEVEADQIDQKLIEQMEIVKKIVEKVHRLRAEAKVKLRQPLAAIEISDYGLTSELLEIIKDEVNVKEVKVAKKKISKELGDIEVTLDSTITQELKEEGIARDVIREIQQARKEAGFTPADKVKVRYSASKELADIIDKNVPAIIEGCNLANLEKVNENLEFSKTVKICDGELRLSLGK